MSIGLAIFWVKFNNSVAKNIFISYHLLTMSGHSKWSTIKRSKGLADAKRGQVFTKLALAITLAVKLGSSGDPGSNPRLRLALDQAKSANMPKGNIERAIEKGLGKGKEALEEVFYEGFGPTTSKGKVAFLVEGVTDNKLRTNAEIKNLFDRSGGAVAGQGSVAYMFDKKGEIIVKGRGLSVEEEILEIIDCGAEDVEDFEEDGVRKYLIYTNPTSVGEVSNKVVQLTHSVESADVIFKPNATVSITDSEEVKKVIRFAEKLEDHPDVQKVYSNFEIAEEITKIQ